MNMVEIAAVCAGLILGYVVVIGLINSRQEKQKANDAKAENMEKEDGSEPEIWDDSQIRKSHIKNKL